MSDRGASKSPNGRSRIAAVTVRLKPPVRTDYLTSIHKPRLMCVSYNFLLRWSSLAALTDVRRATLLKFFRDHNSQRTETIERRLAAITAAVPLTTDQAVIDASVVMVRALAAQMKTTLAAVREFDRKIEELCQSHEDFDLFASLPGVGKVYASRLLVAIGSNRERWRSADELLCFSGVAPVVERERQVVLDAVAVLLPEVRPSSIRRVRGREHPPLRVGTSFLHVTESQRQEPLSGGACACLQVDQDHLEVLADANEL